MTKEGRNYFVKCPKCEEKFDRSIVENEKIQNRYYHKECAELKRQDEQDKEELINFIEQEIGVNCNRKILNQIAKYRRGGYRYKGMKYTIEYYMLLGFDVDEIEGVGFIPFHYDAAKQHYLTKKDVEKASKNTTPTRQREITISPPHKKDRYKRKNDIDIENL